MGCGGSTPADDPPSPPPQVQPHHYGYDGHLDAIYPVGQEPPIIERPSPSAGSPPRPQLQAPGSKTAEERQLQQAMAESQQMAQEEAELQRAIAASKATAPPPRPQPPMIRQQTSGEELRRALALSREMATNRAQRSAVTSHMDDLERAIANSKQHWSPPTTWAKGVGTAFECLQIVGGDGGGNVWTPIVHPDIIDQLGRLCACNPVSEVDYSVDGVRHKTTMRDDGMLMQKEMDSSRQTLLRLVPFFFEYREDDGSWCPIQEPEAITALTAVLATSKNHVYKCQTKDHGPQMYEASLVNEQGLMLQSNIATDNPPRQLRATPVGPDGQPHFEFLEAEVNWKPGLSNWSAVPREINAMLAACAAGFGDAHFVINGATYTATRGLDGFVDQTNMLTGVKRC